MEEVFSSEKKQIICKGVIQVADTQLYKYCGLSPPRKDVIPVLDTGIQKTSFKSKLG